MNKNKTAICEHCDDEVPYTVNKVNKHFVVKGVDIEAEVLEAHCDICGNLVNPYEVSRHNDIAIYDAYKRKMGLLTSQEIIDIRKKRKMSQRKLATFISCGEKNIARYENGAIQDPVFDYLIRLVGDDEVYKAIVKHNNMHRKQILV